MMENWRSNLYIFFMNSIAGYILQVTPFIFFVGILFWIIRGKWLKNHNLQRNHSAYEITLLLFACYLGGLFALVLAPPNFWHLFWFRLINGYSGRELCPFFSGGFNFVPSFFRYITENLTSGSWGKFMLLGNTLLFIPFGFLLPAIWKNANSTKTISLGLALSVLIELGQPIVGRSFDVDDIISNTLGTIIGYLLLIFLQKVTNRLYKPEHNQQKHNF